MGRANEYAKKFGIEIMESCDANGKRKYEKCKLTEEEFSEFLQKAENLVWYTRAQIRILNIKDGIEEELEPDIAAGRDAAMKRIEEKYGDLLDKDEDIALDEWEYGYWSGVLATLRFVLNGMNEETLEYILDT